MLKSLDKMMDDCDDSLLIREIEPADCVELFFPPSILVQLHNTNNEYLNALHNNGNTFLIFIVTQSLLFTHLNYEADVFLWFTEKITVNAV